MHPLARASESTMIHDLALHADMSIDQDHSLENNALQTWLIGCPSCKKNIIK
jgi:hypothetical protein